MKRIVISVVAVVLVGVLLAGCARAAPVHSGRTFITGLTC